MAVSTIRICIGPIPEAWNSAFKSESVVTPTGVSFSLANQGLTSDVAFGQFRTDSDTGIGSINLRTGSLVKLTHFPAGVSGTGWMAVDGSWLVWEQSDSNVDPTNWTLRALNLVSSEQLILTGSTKLAGGLFQMGQSPVPVVSNGVVAWGEPTASPDNSPRSKVVLYNLTSRQAMTIDAGIVSSPVFAGDKLVWAKIDPTSHAYSFAAVQSDTLASVDVTTLFPKPDSIVNLAGSGEYLAWTLNGSMQMEVLRLSDHQLREYPSPDDRHHLQFPMLVSHYAAWYSGNVSSVLDLDTGRAFDVNGSVAAASGTIAKLEPVGVIPKGGNGQVTVSGLSVSSVPGMPATACA